MITEFNSGLARVVYTGDEETTEYPFSFTLKDNSELNVKILNGSEDVTSDFTFTVNYSTPKIVFSGLVVPTNANTIIIFRRTDITNEAVDFNDISVLKSKDLNKAVEQLFDTIQELQDSQLSLENIDVNIENAIEAAVTPLDTRIDSLETSQGSQDIVLVDLEDRLAFIEENGAGDLGPLTARVTAAEADITAIESVNTTQGTTISTHTSQIADHETRIDALEAGGGVDPLLEGRVEDLELSQATQDTAITGLDTRLDTAESDISALETSQGTQDTAITGLDTRLDAVETDLSALNTEVDTLTSTTGSALSGLDTRLDTAESDITAIESAATTLEGRVSSAESNISAVHSIALDNADEIFTFGTGLKDRTTALETSQGTQDTTIAGLDTRLDTAESDITALEAADVAMDTRVDALEAALNYDNLEKYRSGKDAEGLFVTVEWKTSAGVRRKDSILSGGTTPLYTTRTVRYFAADGTTVLSTLTYTLAYDGDDDLTSEVL